MNTFLDLGTKKKHAGLLLFFLFACVLLAMAQPVSWMSLRNAQKQASENNMKVMLFAEADWCQYCQRMHKQVFPNKSVQDSLKKYFYPVSLDVESDQKVIFNGRKVTQRALARKFRVSGTPTTIFIDSDGKILGKQPGFLRSEIFDKLLAYVGAERYKDESFKEYLDKLNIEVH